MYLAGDRVPGSGLGSRRRPASSDIRCASGRRGLARRRSRWCCGAPTQARGPRSGPCPLPLRGWASSGRRGGARVPGARHVLAVPKPHPGHRGRLCWFLGPKWVHGAKQPAPPEPRGTPLLSSSGPRVDVCVPRGAGPSRVASRPGPQGASQKTNAAEALARGPGERGHAVPTARAYGGPERPDPGFPSRPLPPGSPPAGKLPLALQDTGPEIRRRFQPCGCSTETWHDWTSSRSPSHPHPPSPPQSARRTSLRWHSGPHTWCSSHCPSPRQAAPRLRARLRQRAGDGMPAAGARPQGGILAAGARAGRCSDGGSAGPGIGGS
ncbi:collagen alpha-1(III) chain-like isoform X1 [Vulpes lagopus]|uniref:collagen alpha-1(III) chain-like isoform X1 n=1 Tax=Vulpes lagopus TaxID=494514 RepID=UPI001BC9564D|nr:collagen alpha-1(III) chain-like isoform X1 [Vulpes lagopus]